MNTVIPTEKRVERIQFDNPWWIKGRIHEEYRQLRKRYFFDSFYKSLKVRDIKRALVLMGPRRVGKTVMMLHAIQELIDEGVNPHKIIFIGIDNPIYMHLGLEDLMKLSLSAIKQDSIDGCFVFFDEIQYLKDWERHLKVLVDSYPNTKFIVSGSAAAALKLQSSESGAGRFTDFLLPPLTFKEYINLKDLDNLIYIDRIELSGKQIPFYKALNIRTLNEEFFEYLNYGGYPEVVLNKSAQNEMGKYVRTDIIDKVLLRDLPSLYGIRDVQELNSFFGYVAYNTGNEFSYDKISKDSGLHKETIKKYLEYLEAAFLIKVIHKVDVTARNFKRLVNFKVYLTNTSLRTAMFSPVIETDNEVGRLVENIVFSQWLHQANKELKYSSWKNGRKEGEVDIVSIENKYFKPIWCAEIKWSNRFYEHPSDLKSLIYFCTQNKLSSALVTTMDKFGYKKVDGIDLIFLPVSELAYNSGLESTEFSNYFH
jgi:hypothetical protein